MISRLGANFLGFFGFFMAPLLVFFSGFFVTENFRLTLLRSQFIKIKQINKQTNKQQGEEGQAPRGRRRRQGGRQQEGERRGR